MVARHDDDLDARLAGRSTSPLAIPGRIGSAKPMSARISHGPSSILPGEGDQPFARRGRRIDQRPPTACESQDRRDVRDERENDLGRAERQLLDASISAGRASAYRQVVGCGGSARRGSVASRTVSPPAAAISAAQRARERARPRSSSPGQASSSARSASSRSSSACRAVRRPVRRASGPTRRPGGSGSTCRSCRSRSGRPRRASPRRSGAGRGRPRLSSR